MKICLFILSTLFFFFVGCTSSDEKETAMGKSVGKDFELHIDNKEECANFLKGENFSSGKAKIEFSYDGNAYVYNAINNNVVFAGYVEIGEAKGTGRNVRIHDSTRGAQFLNLLLDSDGKLTDQSDYTTYEIPTNHEQLDPAVKRAMEADSMQMSPGASAELKHAEPSKEVQQKLFTGSKKFCDDEDNWYYVVTVEDNKITLKSFAGSNNKAYQDKSTPKDIIKGEITSDNTILTINEDGQMVQIYRYKNGNLYERGYEGVASIFHECK
jgi:hypothetical protein